MDFSITQSSVNLFSAAKARADISLFYSFADEKSVLNLKKIAIYGKGGIGKSTTTSNLSAALCDKGYKVMQIGCDPKADSTRMLMGGRRIPAVLDKIREGSEVKLEDIVYMGYHGAACVESGGPTPGVGCAGRGIVTAFETLERLKAYEIIQPDVVLYDVLGDVVCGGFAMPIRGGYADHVLVVTSGEMMSLYAADNIVRAVKQFDKRGYAKYGGLILNCRQVEQELEKVQQFAEETQGKIIGIIPRDSLVQQAETMEKTVIEAFPDSSLSSIYRDLADHILREL